MKSITIYGNTMIVSSGEYTINESMPDFWKSLFGGKNKKQEKAGFLGTVLSLIPGLGEKMEGKEKADAYTEAQTKWFGIWQDRRKKELEKDQEHLMKMKVANYEILQQKKLNKHDAERKVKDFKQKQELDARKAVLAQLKRENKKIEAWAGLGPSTPEFMAQVIKASERIYEDATPAEQKIKDNVLGIIADISRNDRGEYITDSAEVAKRFDELYGERDSDGKIIEGSGKNNPMFDSPELRSAYETFVANRPQSETEFTQRMVKSIIDNPDFKTNEELDDEKRTVEDRINQMREDDDRIKKLQDEKKKIEDNLEKIGKKKKASDEATKIKDEWEKATPDQIREKLATEINDAMKNAGTNDENKDALFIKNTDGVDDDGNPKETYKINPNSPLCKNLISMGFTQDEIDNLKGMGKDAVLKRFKEIKDDSLTNYKDDLIKTQDTIIQTYEDAKTAEAENTKRLNEIMGKDENGNPAKDENGNSAGELAKAEALKKEHDNSSDAKRAAQITRRYNPSIPNDGTPITKEAMMKVSTTVEHRKEENDRALKEIDEMSARAKKYRKELADDNAYDKAYDGLSDEEKQKIDSITAGQDKVIIPDKDGKREYMEVDGEEDDPDNPGKKRKKRLYKPDKDDPDYETKLQAWDTAVSAKFATMPIGEKPVAQHTPPDFNDIKAMREWEANKKAKEAAKQDFIEKNKGEYKNPEDALDVLSDKEWLQDQNVADMGTEDDEENINGKDVKNDTDKKDADRIKELEDKKNDGKDLTPEEQDELDKLKKKIEDKKKDTDRIKELEDKKNNGKDLDPKEQDELDELKKKIEDDNTIDDDSVKKNPASIWKKKKNKTTGKSTKRYYYCGKNAKRRDANDSLSPQEYQERLKKYKEAKAAESNESITNPQRPIRFKKSPWTMTKLCEAKK